MVKFPPPIQYYNYSIQFNLMFNILFCFFKKGSKKKPMSMDEKKNKVCEFFLEKNDFFTFKEVEKAIAKEKGVGKLF